MAEKGYVFVSYSSRDSTFVKEITNAMNLNKIDFWKAPEMIPAGSNYAREIPQAINGCDVFLLVVSGTSQNSIWVEKEVDTAICARKKIIPVRIDEEALNDLYRFYLNNVQILEAQVKDGAISNISRILQRLQEVLDNEGPLGETSIKIKDNSKVKTNVLVKSPDKRSNALRINRIPLECEFCGGTVEQTSMGIYKCLSCGKENYDDFQKVRNYLEKVGSAPVALIAKNTGVSTKTIEYFWNEEFLEIPSAVNVRLSCSRCGMPIRTGSLCDRCKIGSMEQANNVLKGVESSKKWKK